MPHKLIWDSACLLACSHGWRSAAMPGEGVCDTACRHLWLQLQPPPQRRVAATCLQCMHAWQRAVTPNSRRRHLCSSAPCCIVEGPCWSPHGLPYSASHDTVDTACITVTSLQRAVGQRPEKLVSQGQTAARHADPAANLYHGSRHTCLHRKHLRNTMACIAHMAAFLCLTASSQVQVRPPGFCAVATVIAPRRCARPCCAPVAQR